MPTTALTEITDAQWQVLASRRIFFGHQSVGRNILAGVGRVLEENPEIRLRILGADDPASVEGAAFIEADIGQNTRPDTKADAFAKALDGGFGDEVGSVAMYKHCYVDVQARTDPDRLFADYAERNEALRKRYPGLVFVHVTMPLTTVPVGVEERIRTAMAFTTHTRLNAKRARYNDLLRARYERREPIFDLARFERTGPDGSRAFTSYRGAPIPVMATEWTDDGGHLNERAQRAVGERLLVLLARLPEGAAGEKGPEKSALADHSNCGAETDR